MVFVLAELCFVHLKVEIVADTPQKLRNATWLRGNYIIVLK